jgi:hypothetical protein
MLAAVDCEGAAAPTTAPRDAAECHGPVASPQVVVPGAEAGATDLEVFSSVVASLFRDKEFNVIHVMTNAPGIEDSFLEGVANKNKDLLKEDEANAFASFPRAFAGKLRAVMGVPESPDSVWTDRDSHKLLDVTWHIRSYTPEEIAAIPPLLITLGDAKARDILGFDKRVRLQGTPPPTDKWAALLAWLTHVEETLHALRVNGEAHSERLMEVAGHLIVLTSRASAPSDDKAPSTIAKKVENVMRRIQADAILLFSANISEVFDTVLGRLTLPLMVPPPPSDECIALDVFKHFKLDVRVDSSADEEYDHPTRIDSIIANTCEETSTDNVVTIVQHVAKTFGGDHARIARFAGDIAPNLSENQLKKLWNRALPFAIRAGIFPHVSTFLIGIPFETCNVTWDHDTSTCTFNLSDLKRFAIAGSPTEWGARNGNAWVFGGFGDLRIRKLDAVLGTHYLDLVADKMRVHGLTMNFRRMTNVKTLDKMLMEHNNIYPLVISADTARAVAPAHEDEVAISTIIFGTLLCLRADVRSHKRVNDNMHQILIRCRNVDVRKQIGEIVRGGVGATRDLNTKKRARVAGPVTSDAASVASSHPSDASTVIDPHFSAEAAADIEDEDEQ